MTSNPFEVPQQLRDTATTSVEQAKEAFDQFLDATSKAIETGDSASRSASGSASDMSRQAVSFMEDNVSATFDLAQRLVQARTMEEMAALQQEYFRRQATSMAKQGQDLGEAMTRMARDATNMSTKKS